MDRLIVCEGGGAGLKSCAPVSGRLYVLVYPAIFSLSVVKMSR